MEYLYSVYGLLLVLGIIALIVVGIIYLNQKKKISNSVSSTVVESDLKVLKNVDDHVELSVDSLMAYLSPIRNDEPVFIRLFTNMIDRTKTLSEIKMIEIVAKRLEAESKFLTLIKDHKELLHKLIRQETDYKQQDKIKDLNHELASSNLLSKIELLKNPPPPPAPPPPPKSQAERKAEDKRRREAEAARQETEVRGWRKELSGDPNFKNEDIETEIERRKRARGWLEGI